MSIGLFKWKRPSSYTKKLEKLASKEKHVLELDRADLTDFLTLQYFILKNI